MRMDCHKKAAEIDRLKNIELVSEIFVDQQDMNASWNMTAPVSYTHLDVYKRQVQASLWPPIMRKLCHDNGIELL